ncbi:MAG: hypothetical protein JWP44_1989 [Mucilaginibacter sp.]|nr:hypothetical protein [Mucilaginibacter sp.]
MINNTVFSKDLANRKLDVTREFNAPASKVWTAWTESSILDKWWAPKPWRAETKTMDFSEGGLWLYCMVGPEGEEHWSRVDFKAINPGQSFKAVTTFCDENGKVDTSAPLMYWFVQFKETATGSKVEVAITFDKEADMEKIIAMGFEGGFTMGLRNLEELLEA